ncbi:hypothetical protein ACJ72_04684 [Emergomyces africanus]|uniref:Cep57 centrosome microtubule-binding domain-containing protein n=1 Tax=Emergomyces africanus TaxID=1955775 RepID=A0A1B7NWI6_9EURO|nr:hypothetical protein ACJ72_04684 [Emergomyces africanus]
MAPRDHTNTSDVMANSHASRDPTTSDFDPDHEALVSTRQLDNYHRQPLPKRAKRHDAPAEPESEPDFAIDTSALQRAFPDFSDAPSSDEDDDISVEIGRGGSKPAQRLDDSRDSVMSIDNSRHSASPGIRVDRFGVASQRAVLRSIPNRSSSGRDNLRKGAQIRRASLALKNNNLPQEVKSKSGSQRPTLSEMHAKVSETYDGSYISDERPAKVISTTRNTRFGNTRTHDQGAKIIDAVNKAAGKTYLKHNGGDINQGEPQRQLAVRGPEINSTTDNLTHQSYALPDVPNLSDLVSGIYEDGTPKKRSRATRFTSPPTGRQRYEHLPLESIPVPDDEKAIFISLKLLQEKVEALQMDKSDMQDRLEEIEEENMILKSENLRFQKQDKRRLSMYGGGEDFNDGGVGKLSIHVNRLEEANLALQHRLDASTRKISTHESTIKQLTQERDSARTQLGVAYLNLQELKIENDMLAQENDELKIQLESLTQYPETTDGRRRMQTRDSRVKDREPTTRDVTRETKTYRTRVENPDANDSTQQSVVDVPLKNSHRMLQDRSQPRVPSRPKETTANQQTQAEYDALFSLDLSHLTTQQLTRKTKTRANTAEKKLPNTSKQRSKKAVVEYLEDRDLSEGEIGYRTGPTNDMTFLSFIDANEIAQLRKTLEEERVARKNRLNRDFTEQSKTGNLGLRPSGGFAHFAPLKSSLKNTTSMAGRTATHELPDFSITDHRSAANTRNLSARNVTDHSTSNTAGPKRQRKRAEEMTSAFILPDITMHGITSKPGEPLKLSEAAQRVLDNVAQHDGKNCTVCKSVMNKNSTHELSNGERQECIKVTKPVPVSDRMPASSPYNEEPTLRPSQPPGVALATVLKSLEDELAHLKMQLALQQTTLNKHDASLGRKQRKSLVRRIESLLKEIDTKSDQIYALYDVLEGQKENGHEMTQEEIDVTLQSIGLGRVSGIDAGDHTDRLSRDDTKGKKVTRRQEDSDSGSDDDDEPPWEGFESTGDLTGRSLPRKTVKTS